MVELKRQILLDVISKLFRSFKILWDTNIHNYESYINASPPRDNYHAIRISVDVDRMEVHFWTPMNPGKMRHSSRSFHLILMSLDLRYPESLSKRTLTKTWKLTRERYQTFKDAPLGAECLSKT